MESGGGLLYQESQISRQTLINSDNVKMNNANVPPKMEYMYLDLKMVYYLSWDAGKYCQDSLLPPFTYRDKPEKTTCSTNVMPYHIHTQRTWLPVQVSQTGQIISNTSAT